MCRAMYPQCKVEARGRILQQSPDVWNLDKLDFVAAEGTQDWERLYEFEDERVRIETCLQYLVQ